MTCLLVMLIAFPSAASADSIKFKGTIGDQKVTMMLNPDPPVYVGDGGTFYNGKAAISGYYTFKVGKKTVKYTLKGEFDYVDYIYHINMDAYNSSGKKMGTFVVEYLIGARCNIEGYMINNAKAKKKVFLISQ